MRFQWEVYQYRCGKIKPSAIRYWYEGGGFDIDFVGEGRVVDYLDVERLEPVVVTRPCTWEDEVYRNYGNDQERNSVQYQECWAGRNNYCYQRVGRGRVIDCGNPLEGEVLI